MNTRRVLDQIEAVEVGLALFSSGISITFSDKQCSLTLGTAFSNSYFRWAIPSNILSTFSIPFWLSSSTKFLSYSSVNLPKSITRTSVFVWSS